MPRRRRMQLLVAAVAAVIIALDQLSKAWALASLSPVHPTTVISGWLQFRLAYNTGAAFSLSTGTPWLFTLIAAVVCLAIVWISRRLVSAAWAVALGMLLGGAIGNVIDRIFRDGKVTDFIEFLRFPVIDFPIFNLADSAIVVAAGLVLIFGMRNIPATTSPESVAGPTDSTTSVADAPDAERDD